MQNEDKEKKEYELALLLKSEEDLVPVVAFLKEHDAEISSEPKAKKLALAYEIKGLTEAVFVYCNFKAFGENAKSIEQDLNTNNNVVRSMIIASPPPASERQSVPYFPGKRPGRAPSVSGSHAEVKPSAPRPLSNEALEKKIEEILQ